MEGGMDERMGGWLGERIERQSLRFGGYWSLKGTTYCNV